MCEKLGREQQLHNNKERWYEKTRILGFGLSASAALAHSPNGQTYNVAVFSSFDTNSIHVLHSTNRGR
jgi:hypothetical protein